MTTLTQLEQATADPSSCAVESDHFRAWWNFWGQLDRITDDDCGPTRLWGFENQSEPGRVRYEVPAVGASYGYLDSGSALLVDDAARITLAPGEWFAMPAGFELVLGPASRLIFSQREGFRSPRQSGGPIEHRGRLRYIDGCSDTLLACPPVKGDPCLNHLHFPPSITQTEHYHPSVRSGTVARGLGWCETPLGLSPLVPGMAFVIPRHGLHRFLTERLELDVIAYHPDSDWGPTDEDHPMVNRTWVGEGKIDNSGGAHAAAAIEERWLHAPMAG